MAKPDVDGDVRKVYISDSPVLDDQIEYNYVSSDIEDELDKTDKIKSRRKTPAPKPPTSSSPIQPDIHDYIEPEGVMAPVTGGGPMTDEDELAREAQYQKELQDRLEKATIDDKQSSPPLVTITSSGNDNIVVVIHEPPCQGHQDDLDDNNDHIKLYTNVDNTTGVFEEQGNDNVIKGTDDNNAADLDDDLLAWQNPPVNPFANHNPTMLSKEHVNDRRYEDMNQQANQSSDDEKFVPENLNRSHQRPSQQVQQPMMSRNVNAHQANLPTNQYEREPNHNSSSAIPSQQPNLYQHQHNMAPRRQVAFDTAAQQSPNASYQTYEAHLPPQHHQQQLPPQHQRQPTNPADQHDDNPADYDEQYDDQGQDYQVDYQVDSYAFQQQMADIEFAQQNQVNGYSSGATGLQRNMPVMYMNTQHQQPNEYYMATPKEIRHPYYTQEELEELNAKEQTEADNGKQVVAVVAPKPVKPSRNFVERNKHRALGQHSAKPGYSDKLVQKRIDQEHMKEWAPGMIVPRKKAASADDIARSLERQHDRYESPEGIWAKRSRELASVKQAKVAAGSTGRRGARKTHLPRFPSDTSLSKKAKVPPINQPREPKGYLNNYHLSQKLNNDYGAYNGHLPGQVPNGIPPVTQQPRQAFYHSSPSLVYQPQQQAPSYAQQYVQQLLIQENRPDQSNGYISPSLSPQYGGYYTSPHPNEHQPVSGPPSGGYHHQPRYVDVTQSPVGYQQAPSNPYHHQQPPQRLQQQQHQAGHAHSQMSPTHANLPRNKAAHPVHNGQYGGAAFQPEGRHPAYDYSGYAENFSGQDVETVGAQTYDGSPYSSPYIPDKKPPGLNPYAAVPPIHQPNQHKPANTRNPANRPQQQQQQQSQPSNQGSYMMVYQKEKEKAENKDKTPTYKVYTMKDYKSLKLDYRLGGLGPSQDPETIREKNEVRQKQLQYAKEAMDAEKKKPHKSPRQAEDDEVKHISGRQLALEYAKHVPKPKVSANQNAAYQPENTTPRSNQQSPEQRGKIRAMQPLNSAADQQHRNNDSMSRLSDTTWTQAPTIKPMTKIQLQDLEDLQRRHEEERLAVSELQYRMQQTA